MELKLRQFKGEERGPHLLVTAGVHGDEYVPVIAARELIDVMENNPLPRGTVTIIPVVNESAFALGRRCGEDGQDLARTCPGRSDGSVTERVAHALAELIRQADAFIDLHSGGTELRVFPLVGYMLHEDAKVLRRQRAMARAFNLPLVWGTSAELDGRSLSVARDAGVPAIYVEYLGGVEADLPGVESLVDGCLNVMGLLGNIERDHDGPEVREVIEDGRPDAGHMQACYPAPATGLFHATVELGQEVQPGDPLGWVMDPLSGETQEIQSRQAGKVVVLRGVPRVTRGESIGVVAERGHGP